jgi:hypothetical protein
MIKYFLFVLLTLLAACSGFGTYEHGYRIIACFTTEKDTFSISETVVFYNCSEYYYKKRPTAGSGYWRFRDGSSANAKIQDTVYHVYDSTSVVC